MTDYRGLAENSWSWVLEQVRWDDGPWIPLTVNDSGPAWDRDGFHSGIGGLAHLLAELRLSRELNETETQLATAIGQRLRQKAATSVDITFFDGLVSTLGALIALDEPGAEQVITRLSELVDAEPSADAHHLDATLGVAGILLGAVWAKKHDVPGADALAQRTAKILLDESEPTATGLNWRFLPRREAPDHPEMPNFSHGLAGISAALAVAGRVEPARRGGEHLVTLGRREGDGFVLPRRIPRAPDQDELTHNWCHGGAGTSLAFAAYQRAGITSIAGDSPAVWRRRSLQGVQDAGVPERRYPGFWDNDGRCCGTAGVADVFLDLWQSDGEERDLAYALTLTEAIAERAVENAYWRFVEHTADEPLLPAGVGWMQGATGIAAYLFRVSRVLEHGRDAPVAARMDNWWVS